MPEQAEAQRLELIAQVQQRDPLVRRVDAQRPDERDAPPCRDELARLVAAVGERDEVAMLELNVSCPNVETGLIMGADPAETALALGLKETAACNRYVRALERLRGLLAAEGPPTGE